MSSHLLIRFVVLANIGFSVLYLWWRVTHTITTIDK
jgi:hypothetical protein